MVWEWETFQDKVFSSKKYTTLNVIYFPQSYYIKAKYKRTLKNVCLETVTGAKVAWMYGFCIVKTRYKCHKICQARNKYQKVKPKNRFPYLRCKEG